MQQLISLFPPSYLVLTLCVITIALFIHGRLSVDAVAILVLVVLGIISQIPGYEILSHQQLFSGFSSNAVISIIAVMILGAALDRAGLMRSVARRILNLSGHSEKRIIPLVSGNVGLLSGFMQNVGAAALFLPVVNRISKRTGISSSRLLMPMGFCAIVGGTLTMVGSGPLIILNDLLPAEVIPFDLFDVTPIGLGLLAATILYFLLMGRMLLPTGKTNASLNESRNKLMAAYEVNAKVTAVRLQHDSPLTGKSVGEIESLYHINIIAMENAELCMSPHRELELEEGTCLALMADEQQLQQFVALPGVQPDNPSPALRNALDPDISGVIELLVSPHSKLAGQRIKDFRIRKTYGLTPLAIHRNGRILHKDLRETRLAVGDILLCHAAWDDLRALERDPDLTLLSNDFPHEPINQDKLGRALTIFLLTLLAIIFFEVKLSLALMTGAILMVINGVLSMEQAYQAVSWKTVFLLAGLIPLGIAVENSGAADLVASFALGMLGDASLLTVEILVALLATLFSLIMSNVGATVLLVPMVAKLALSLGIDPRICILIVGICVSNSFIIPTHQVNALIMSPGNYRVIDFVRAGGLMSLLFIFVTIGLINIFY